MIVRAISYSRSILNRVGEMNLLDASIEVSLAQGYPTVEFAASGGVLNPKRE
jgi:hypothetical protein